MTLAGTAYAVRERLFLHYRFLLILAAAAAVMGHELVFGIGVSDSLRYNLVWTDQFVGQVRAGDPYPRWLPDSWAGLGSPTFYIYPPLYFWAAAVVDGLSLGTLPVTHLVPVTSFLILALSGAAMHLWLKRQGSGRFSLAGAILYVAAPYHLNDIYARGALAEATVYAVLPIVMLAFRRLGCGRRHALLPASASYAALILAHPPSALIVSLFVLAPFVLFRAATAAGGKRRLLAESAAAVLLGVGLSSFYLIPALRLMEFVSQDAFFGPFYRPETWFVWNAANWPRTSPMAWSLLVCAIAVPLFLQSMIQARRDHAVEPLFWCGVGLFSVVMALGLLPFLWEIPFLDRVQFPYRFLLITEFATITAVAGSMPRLRAPLAALATVVWAFASGLAILVMSSVTASVDPAGKAQKVAQILSDRRDAPEYLPASYEIAFGSEPGVPESDAVELPDVPEAALFPARGAASELRGRDGSARLEVRSAVPATLTLRRHYFPHWRVTDGNGRKIAARESPEGLLSWAVPAGTSRFFVGHGPAPGERMGLLVSMGAVLLLVCAAFVLQRSARRVQGPAVAQAQGE